MAKNFFTGRTSFLQLMRDDYLIATGTAFFVRKNKNLFLITARHNLTGRHWETGRCLSERTAALPNRMRINAPIVEQKVPGRFGYKEYTLPLNLDTDPPIAIWLEAGPKEKPWDIAAVPVHPDWESAFIERWKTQYCLEGDFAIATMSECGTWEVLVQQQHQVGSSAFVLGFPFGKTGGVENQPIWRSGSVATEPSVDWEGIPAFLVDVSGRQGMSGSPVIIRTDSQHFILGGVYTGRLLDKGHNSELGYVWKLSAVDHLLSEGRMSDSI
ncbi:MAG: serine protease [Sphingomonadales bacterium]|nr:MAG: serine protease [Sphingomonadales bacterium]TNF04806.1 MAG: serine protease [Sphingomonadales bacterium]